MEYFGLHVANFHEEEVDGVENATCTAISASGCSIYGMGWKSASLISTTLETQRDLDSLDAIECNSFYKMLNNCLKDVLTTCFNLLT